MSLTNCLKSLDISKDTAKDVKRIARSYREDDGMSPNDASLAAAKDILSDLIDYRNQISEEIESKGHEAPRRSEAAVKADLTEGGRTAKLSRKWPIDPSDDIPTALVKTIGADMDNFVTELSDKKSMADIANDVAKQVKVQEAAPLPNPDQTPQTAQAAFLEKRRNKPDMPYEYWLTMTDENGKEIVDDLHVPMTATVLEFKREGVIEIDISSFKKGNGGNVIYQVVANYALNNGLRFQGDRQGLSPIARIRRTEQMLAAAAKAGTTTHLLPHHWQYQGETGTENVEGVVRLDWRRDEDNHNLKEMVNSLTDTWHNLVPSLNEMTYNFETERFENEEGQLIEDGVFEDAAESARANELQKEGGGSLGYTDEQGIPAGSGSLKRAVYFKAARGLQGQAAELLSGQDDRLAKYVRGFKKNTKDGKISYSRKITPEKTEVIPNFSIITPSIVSQSSQDVQQVDGWLKYLQNKGVKKEEMEALGLTAEELSSLSLELFKNNKKYKNPKQLSKEDLLEYIDNQSNQLKFIEEFRVGNRSSYSNMILPEDYGKKTGYFVSVVDSPKAPWQKLPTFTEHFIGENDDSYNNFAHYRATIREDANSKRFLLIEELQSDGHQRARKNGYEDRDLSSEDADLTSKMTAVGENIQDIDVFLEDTHNQLDSLIDSATNDFDFELKKMSLKFVSGLKKNDSYNEKVQKVFKNRSLPDDEGLFNLMKEYLDTLDKATKKIDEAFNKAGIDLRVATSNNSRSMTHKPELFGLMPLETEAILTQGSIWDITSLTEISKAISGATESANLNMRKVPYMPMKVGWEMFLIKKAMVFAKKNGLKQIRFPATYEQVDLIEKWGGTELPGMETIAKRYTEKLPRQINSLIKKYGSKVEKTEFKVKEKDSILKKRQAEDITLIYQSADPVIIKVPIRATSIIHSIEGDSLVPMTVQEYDETEIGEEVYVVGYTTKDSQTNGSTSRAIKRHFSNTTTSNNIRDIVGYDLYEQSLFAEDRSSAENLMVHLKRDMEEEYQRALDLINNPPKKTDELNSFEITPELEEYIDNMTMFSRKMNEGTSYDRNNQVEPEVFYHDTSQPTASESASITSRVKEFIDGFRYEMQDKHIYLKRAQELAGDVSESEDAYGAESLWQGKAGEVIGQFGKSQAEPIMKKIGETGMELEEVERWLHARHAEEANRYLRGINPNRNDNDALSGMTDQEALQILATNQGNEALQEVGSMIDNLNNSRLDMMLEYGLVDADSVAAWRATYEHYVPLRREEQEDLISARASGFNIRGKESRERLGSTLPVTNILAHTFAQYENSIVRGEKNIVGQALFNFAQANNSSGWWTIDELKQVGKVKDGEVQWFNDPRETDEELNVKINGTTHRIRFNRNNKSAIRILKAMKNLESKEMNPFIKTLLGINRFLSSINTSFSPEFIISNFTRDLQTAGYNLGDTELSSMELSVMKNVPGAIKGLKQNIRGDRTDTAWSQWAERFRLAGGKTGWIDNMNNIEDRHSKLEKQLQRIRKGKAPRSVFMSFIHMVEDYNSIAENAVRLAAFKTAVENGVSEQKAAILAKNLTVNFNRKGMSGSTMNALYLFYNASIQGSTRMLQAMVKSKKGRMLAAATIGLSVGLDIMNRAMSGDDDDGENIYDQIPDYVKSRNWIIMGEKEPIVKIPLPWGYNVLHIIGQQIGKGFTGKDFNALDSTGVVMKGIIDSFNPVGSGTLLQTVSPTIGDPAVMIAENKNWAGQPLKPDQLPFGVNKPEYQMHWRKHNDTIMKDVSKFLNDLSGGDSVRPGAINISPEWIEVFSDFATGSAGRVVSNTFSTARKAVAGEELPTQEIPFIRKVTGFDSERQLQSRYYERVEDIQYHRKQLDAAKVSRDKEVSKQLLSNPRTQLLKLEKDVSKALKKLSQNKRKIEQSSLSDKDKEKRVEKIDSIIRMYQARFSRLYSERVKS